MLRNCRVIY